MCLKDHYREARPSQVCPAIVPLDRCPGAPVVPGGARAPEPPDLEVPGGGRAGSEPARDALLSVAPHRSKPGRGRPALPSRQRGRRAGRRRMLRAVEARASSSRSSWPRLPQLESTLELRAHALCAGSATLVAEVMRLRWTSLRRFEIHVAMRERRRGHRARNQALVAPPQPTTAGSTQSAPTRVEVRLEGPAGLVHRCRWRASRQRFAARAFATTS